MVLDTLDANPSGGLPEGALAPLIAGLPLELRPTLERFIASAFAVFHDLDCSLMEMNPW